MAEGSWTDCKPVLFLALIPQSHRSACCGLSGSCYLLLSSPKLLAVHFLWGLPRIWSVLEKRIHTSFYEHLIRMCVLCILLLLDRVYYRFLLGWVYSIVQEFFFFADPSIWLFYTLLKVVYWSLQLSLLNCLFFLSVMLSFTSCVLRLCFKFIYEACPTCNSGYLQMWHNTNS